MRILDEAIDLAEGLLSVIEEETALLKAGEQVSSVKPLVDSKVRLIDQFEKAKIVLNKSDRAAILACEEHKIIHLAQLNTKIIAAADENGAIVQRRLDLTNDLLNAVLTDVRRENGATIMRYGDKGGSVPGHRSAAVSIDARL